MALESNGHMNADGPVVVTVNQRALVDKVLARYPEDFTVSSPLHASVSRAVAKR